MRWERGVAAGALVVLAAAPLWGPSALRPLQFFAVRRIEVAGARYLDPGVVAEGMGLARTASVWDDLDAVERRLENVAGIRSATVTRRVPGTLRVTVEEEEPVALADGPAGLVAVGAAGEPLPYDLTMAPVDAPVVPRADTALLAALATMRTTDLGFYAAIGAATARRGEVVLEIDSGRVRLGLPVEPGVVRQVAAVQRELAASGTAWRELDGRFAGWVVVRRPPSAAPAPPAPARRPAPARQARPSRARGGARA
jgi:cell division protein FtsQ